MTSFSAASSQGSPLWPSLRQREAPPPNQGAKMLRLKNINKAKGTLHTFSPAFSSSLLKSKTESYKAKKVIR